MVCLRTVSRGLSRQWASNNRSNKSVVNWTKNGNSSSSICREWCREPVLAFVSADSKQHINQILDAWLASFHPMHHPWRLRGLNDGPSPNPLGLLCGDQPANGSFEEHVDHIKQQRAVNSGRSSKSSTQAGHRFGRMSHCRTFRYDC